MTPFIITNTAEFNATLNALAAQSRRTYPQIVNGTGLSLASKAIPATVKASTEAIAHELGQIATRIPKIYQGKRAKARFSHRIFRTDTGSFAARIVNARRRDRGEKMLWGDELDRAARNLIAARLKAVAFVRSGWIYAIRTLARVVGYSVAIGRRDAIRMSGQAKGYARAARTTFSDFVVCEIANTALLTKAGRSALPIAEAGLIKAMGETVADMRRHMEEKLGKVFKQYSAR